MPHRLTAALAAGLVAVAGCGDSTPPKTATQRAAPAITTAPPPPAPPTTPPVSRTRYATALDAYCTTVNHTLLTLAKSKPSKRDPAAPVAALATSMRAGVERLATLTPPASARSAHLLVLAQGREAAGRLDTGAQLARRGDTDAATAALLDLKELLPQLPASLRRAAPDCK